MTKKQLEAKIKSLEATVAFLNEDCAYWREKAEKAKWQRK